MGATAGHQSWKGFEWFGVEGDGGESGDREAPSCSVLMIWVQVGIGSRGWCRFFGRRVDVRRLGVGWGQVGIGRVKGRAG